MITQSEREATQLIYDELKKAKTKWPQWVDDPVHAAGILAEESGELMQAALDFCYSGGDIERMKTEAAQVGAVAIRILEGVHRYERVQRYEGRA